MKKTMIGLLLLLLLPMSIACGPPAQEAPAPSDQTPLPQASDIPDPVPPPTQFPPRPAGLIHTDPRQTIVVDIGGRFTIGLEVVLRLGAGWQADYDENMLAALSDDYYVDDNLESPGLGGTQYFQFRALKSGETRVEFSLEHGTAGPVSEEKIFTIQIIGVPVREPPEPAAWWPPAVTEGTLLEMYTRTTMAGVGRHLTISADGSIVYYEDRGLRHPTKEYPPVRVTRTGQLARAELDSLLEMVDACPFDAEGNLDARTEIIDTDAVSVLTIYYQGATRTITANYQPLFHLYHPELPELMDVPVPVRDLYRQLRSIIDNKTSQISEEKLST